MKKDNVVAILVVTLLLCVGLTVKNDRFTRADLHNLITTIVHDKRASVAISVIDNEGNSVLGVNDTVRVPLLQVGTIPCAVRLLYMLPKDAVLSETASGYYLTQCGGNDAVVAHSSVSFAQLLYGSLVLNNEDAGDLLLRRVGGCRAVNTFLHNYGIDDITIEVTHRQMRHYPLLQRNNTATPLALTHLMYRCFTDTLLSCDMRYYLQRLLVKNTLLHNAHSFHLLPQHTLIANITGTSRRCDDGKKIAENSVGMIVHPDGRRYYVAVFVTDSYESDATNMAVKTILTGLIYRYTVYEKSRVL